MVTFILIGAFVILAIAFALLAYSMNNRKRAGQKRNPAMGSEQPSEGRAAGMD